MSRIGKKPIPVATGVKVSIAKGVVAVEGPKGKLSTSFRDAVSITMDDGSVVVSRAQESRFARAYHGTARALIANMISGVSQGFQRNLEIVGVGYNAKVKGKAVEINIGFCHPVEVPIPAGIEVVCPAPTRIEIRGPDKQVVGEFAARIRRIRKPEPYKGKGIRYEGEHIVRKAGKAFGAGA